MFLVLVLAAAPVAWGAVRAGPCAPDPNKLYHGCFCFRAGSFGQLPLGNGSGTRVPGIRGGRGGGGLPPLPTRGRWADAPWALNKSTAVFFVGNSTRMETPAEYRSDARWGVMGYSWNVNNLDSNNSHAERWEVDDDHHKFFFNYTH